MHFNLLSINQCSHYSIVDRYCFSNNICIRSFLFFSFVLFPLLCGVDACCHTPPCSTVLHLISRQSLLFDIILYFVQPSSYRFPLFLLPCTFIAIALLPTQCSFLLITCPYHFNLLSWTFFAIFPTFVVRLILSFLFVGLVSYIDPRVHIVG